MEFCLQIIKKQVGAFKLASPILFMLQRNKLYSHLTLSLPTFCLWIYFNFDFWFLLGVLKLEEIKFTQEAPPAPTHRKMGPKIDFFKFLSPFLAPKNRKNQKFFFVILFWLWNESFLPNFAIQAFLVYEIKQTPLFSHKISNQKNLTLFTIIATIKSWSTFCAHNDLFPNTNTLMNIFEQTFTLLLQDPIFYHFSNMCTL